MILVKRICQKCGRSFKRQEVAGKMSRPVCDECAEAHLAEVRRTGKGNGICDDLRTRYEDW